MSHSDQSTGLNIFDETASAVGNFPVAIRGYDRTAVDDYVRSLEARVVQEGHRTTDLKRQLGEVQDQLQQTRNELDQRPTGEVDYSSLGARAGHILRMAEEQAQEMLDNANAEANQLRETGQGDAERLRQQAEAEAERVRRSTRDELEKLRADGRSEVVAEIDRARSEATAISAAAQREADATRREAQQEADSTRQSGYLEGEEYKNAAETEAAEIRRQVAEERETVTAELKRAHQESVTATGQLLTEATQHHQQAGERMAADIDTAAKLRSDAQAEAERIRLDATDEAERVVTAAKTQAERITRRTQQEFAWRKEQLKRDTDNLLQRKQAVLNQLQSLSALAMQSADDVPEMQPLADLSDDLEAFAADPAEVVTDAEQPADLGPTAPGTSAASPDTADGDVAQPPAEATDTEGDTDLETGVEDPAAEDQAQHASDEGAEPATEEDDAPTEIRPAITFDDPGPSTGTEEYEDTIVQPYGDDPTNADADPSRSN